ncbi:hypothetical protein IWQ61_009551 [Dispira simplex]|nr:hypothetical protein IWQ61_009551 [Dispira simplex]
MADSTPKLYDDTLSTLCFIYQDHTAIQGRRRNSSSSETDKPPANETNHQAKRVRTDTGHIVPTDPRLALINPQRNVAAPQTKDPSPLIAEDPKQWAKKKFQDEVYLMPASDENEMAQICSSVVTQSTMLVDKAFRKELLDFIQLKEGADIDSQHFLILAKSYQWFIEVMRLEASEVSSKKAGSIFVSVEVQQRRAVTVFLSQEIVNTLQPRFASIYKRHFSDSQRSFIQKTTGYIWRIGRPMNASSTALLKTSTGQKRPHAPYEFNPPPPPADPSTPERAVSTSKLTLPGKACRLPSSTSIQTMKSPQVESINEEVMLSGTQQQFSPDIAGNPHAAGRPRTPTPVRPMCTLPNPQSTSKTTPDQPIRSKINLSQLNLHKPGALPVPSENYPRAPPPPSSSSSTEAIRSSSSPTQSSLAEPKFTYKHPGVTTTPTTPTIMGTPTASAPLAHAQRPSQSPNDTKRSSRDPPSPPVSPPGMVRQSSDSPQSLPNPHFPTTGSLLNDGVAAITSTPSNAPNTSVGVSRVGSISFAGSSKGPASHLTPPYLQSTPSIPMDHHPNLPTEATDSAAQANRSPVAPEDPGNSVSGVHQAIIECNGSQHPNLPLPSTNTFAPPTPVLGITQGQSPAHPYPWIPTSPQIQHGLSRYPPGVIFPNVQLFIQHGLQATHSSTPHMVIRTPHDSGLVPIRCKPAVGQPTNLPHHPAFNSPAQGNMQMPARTGTLSDLHVNQALMPMSNMHPVSRPGNNHAPQGMVSTPMPHVSEISVASTSGMMVRPSTGMQARPCLPATTSRDNIESLTRTASTPNPADLIRLQLSMLKNTPITIHHTSNAPSISSRSPSLHSHTQPQYSPPATITRAHTTSNTSPHMTSTATPSSASIESIQHNLVALRDVINNKILMQEQQTQAQFRRLDERLTHLEQLMLKVLSST